MKDHQWCEKLVAKMTGGKLTPGSGNKNTKGDVRLFKEGWYIEVKSTERTVMDLQGLWLEKMLKFRGQLDLMLVVFFQKRGYVYEHEPSLNEVERWATKRIVERSLPEEIAYGNSVWKFHPITRLYELKDVD